MPPRHETLLGVAQPAEPEPRRDTPRPASGERERVKSEGIHRGLPAFVDEILISSKRITVRGAVEPTPRIVDRAKVARAPLEPREAFVVELIDGSLTVSDLADASGVPEADLAAILSRLVRLGIISM